MEILHHRLVVHGNFTQGKFAAVDSLVKDDLMNLVKRFLQMCHIDCFVHGNFTPQVSSSWIFYTR